jgi:hypothetical protein
MECWVWAAEEHVWQQRSMYGSRRFVKKFMCEEMAMKICI